MAETSSWKEQWLSFPVIPDEPCRGCMHLSSVHRSGNIHAQIRKIALSNEVRDTPSGAYCLACYEKLPLCPVCEKELTSHAEYPCVSCEVKEVVAERDASGGRCSSPTYRGFSTIYTGKGADNKGEKYRFRAVAEKRLATMAKMKAEREMSHG